MNDEPRDEHKVIMNALLKAADAFEQALEEGDLDPAFAAHKFVGYEVTANFDGILWSGSVSDLPAHLNKRSCD